LALITARALLLVVGPMLLPESRDPQAGRMDLRSAGLAVGVLFVRQQRALADPLLDLRLSGLPPSARPWPPIPSTSSFRLQRCCSSRSTCRSTAPPVWRCW
jgi:hypothetical protein